MHLEIKKSLKGREIYFGHDTLTHLNLEITLKLPITQYHSTYHQEFYPSFTTGGIV